MEQESKREWSLPLILAAFVAVALLYIVFVFGFNNKKNVPETLNTALSTGIKVTRADEGGDGQLPSWLPANIPAADQLTEEVKVEYLKKGVTQYSLSFLSEKSKDYWWKVYTDFATKGGYIIDPAMTKKASGYLYAEKDNDTLAVVITPIGDSTYVQFNLIDR